MVVLFLANLDFGGRDLGITVSIGRWYGAIGGLMLDINLGAARTRVMKVLGLFVLVIVGVVGIGQEGGLDSAGVIRARRIEIVGLDGKVRAMIGEYSEGGAGKEAGVQVSLFDRAGVRRAFMLVSDDGVSRVEVSEGPGSAMSCLTSSGGLTGMMIRGQLGGECQVMANRYATMAFAEKWSARELTMSDKGIVLRDSGQEGAKSLGSFLLTEKGEAELSIHSSKGEVLFSAPVKK